MSAAPDLLGALRRATAAQHARLDGALDFAPGRVDRERFTRFLLATGELLAPLEQALYALPGYVERIPDASLRRKLPLLEADLVALGAGAPSSHARVPAVDDVASAFGAAYVLEGSMLGGAVLARSLGPSLGLTRGHGLAYLTAYGADLGSMWQRFCGALGALGEVLDEAGAARLTSTASSLFEAFFDHFSERGVLGAAAPPGSSAV